MLRLFRTVLEDLEIEQTNLIYDTLSLKPIILVGSRDRYRAVGCNQDSHTILW